MKKLYFIPKVWGDFQFNFQCFNFCNTSSQIFKFLQFDQFYPKILILPLIYLFIYFYIKIIIIRVQKWPEYKKKEILVVLLVFYSCSPHYDMIFKITNRLKVNKDNFKFNNDFKSHIIVGRAQEEY